MMATRLHTFSPTLLTLLSLFSACAPITTQAQSFPSIPGLPAMPPFAANLLADPFATHALPQAPKHPRAAGKTTSNDSYSPPLPAAAPLAVLPPPAAPIIKPLPSGLRVILIRDKGQALLSSNEVGSYSIAVAHGQTVRIGEQNYHAEVSKSQVRLLLSPKAKPIWEGGLAGVTQPALAADAAQARYTPPLSAGVSPGLTSSARSNSATE